mmetsp:Transcript_30860/g.57881  ORF Transcript_30860/g.57881 Transcript_30860/m.57881 type:complete len:149 (+) Transcript_30860:31-477(+)
MDGAGVPCTLLPFKPFCLDEGLASAKLCRWRGKRIAEDDCTLEHAKRRRKADGVKESAKSIVADRCDSELQPTIAAFGACFGETCVANLSSVAWLTLASLVAAGIFILVSISSSLVLAMICSGLCLVLMTLALSNHVLFMTYEGAWAI